MGTNSKNRYIIFPKSVGQNAIKAFLITMVLVSVAYSRNILPFHLWIFDLVSVIGFFYGSWYYTRHWMHYSDKLFNKQLLKTSFVIRLVFVYALYVFYMIKFGTYYGPAGISTDATWYLDEAYYSASRLANGTNIISRWMNDFGVEFADTGYMTYLAIVYIVTLKISKLFFPLLLKALWGALTCTAVYRIAKRHLSPDAARMAAVFCMLCPNMIWWCGCFMKEAEMVFLSTLFIDQADAILMDRKFEWWKILAMVFLGFYLFMFRTVLGAICFMSLFFTLAFTSTRIVSWGKRIAIGVLALGLIGLTMNEAIKEQIEEVTSKDIRAEQQTNMEWRMDRRDGSGNKFAKYAGAAVFAPLIFSIPFPTLSFTYIEQELIMENGGGNFVKNVTSFYVIICMFMLLFSGNWRKHVLPLSFMCGYLVVLVFSSYAQSGRFHMPIVPLEMMFAAMGFSMMERGIPITKHIGNIKKYRHWFSLFLVFEVVVCVAWQYFKLKGQGRI